MTDALREAIRRYTETHAGPNGIAHTAIPGMTFVRAEATGALQAAVQRPLICLVAQGAKQVTRGSQTLTYGGGDSMLLASDAPTLTRIVKASRAAPYLSFALNLDAALIASLTAEMAPASTRSGVAPPLKPTNAEVTDTALRLVRLLDRPASVAVLQAQLVREMHHWLLTGRHGAAIRHLGLPDGRGRRIGRVVEVIRRDFASTLRVEALAAVAGMSMSTFHHHFRAVTLLSPLQFQKQLRLIEARRLMLAEYAPSSSAAHAVGYESVPQFTREYRRFFGRPPGRETRDARREVRTAA